MTDSSLYQLSAAIAAAFAFSLCNRGNGDSNVDKAIRVARRYSVAIAATAAAHAAAESKWYGIDVLLVASFLLLLLYAMILSIFSLITPVFSWITQKLGSIGRDNRNDRSMGNNDIKEEQK